MIFTATLASGQDLGGKWFQVTFSVKGYESGSDYYSVDHQVSAKTVNYFAVRVQRSLVNCLSSRAYSPVLSVLRDTLVVS